MNTGRITQLTNNANADNPRRLAVEAQNQRLRRTIGRDCVETLLALQSKAFNAQAAYETYAQQWESGKDQSQLLARRIAAVEANGALERFLDDLEVRR